MKDIHLEGVNFFSTRLLGNSDYTFQIQPLRSLLALNYGECLLQAALATHLATEQQEGPAISRQKSTYEDICHKQPIHDYGVSIFTSGQAVNRQACLLRKLCSRHVSRLRTVTMKAVTGYVQADGCLILIPH